MRQAIFLEATGEIGKKLGVCAVSHAKLQSPIPPPCYNWEATREVSVTGVT
jgi:hypothetical protein